MSTTDLDSGAWHQHGGPAWSSLPANHPPGPGQGKVMPLHWWHGARLGDMPLLLMLSRAHQNRRLLWPLEKGVWAGAGEGRMPGRWMLYPAHHWPCHPPQSGVQPHSRALRIGALSEAAVQLPMSCPHCCRAAGERGLLLAQGQAPAPPSLGSPPPGWANRSSGRAVVPPTPLPQP